MSAVTGFYSVPLRKHIWHHITISYPPFAVICYIYILIIADISNSGAVCSVRCRSLKTLTLLFVNCLFIFRHRDHRNPVNLSTTQHYDRTVIKKGKFDEDLGKRCYVQAKDKLGAGGFMKCVVVFFTNFAITLLYMLRTLYLDYWNGSMYSKTANSKWIYFKITNCTY